MKKNKLKGIITKFIATLLLTFSIGMFSVNVYANKGIAPYQLNESSITYSVDKNEKKEYKGKILLDLAHSDTPLDKGTVYGEYNERDIANNITLKVKDILEKNGVEVIMIRQVGESISINERVKLANGIDNYDYYISIHINSCEVENSGTGVESFSCSAWSISNRILKELSKEFKYINRGVYESPYYNSSINQKSTILELGFLNNEYDREKLVNEQDTYANIIARGIIEQLEIDYNR